MNVTYLGFNKTLDTVSHDILINKPQKYGLDQIKSDGCRTDWIGTLKKIDIKDLGPNSGEPNLISPLN